MNGEVTIDVNAKLTIPDELCDYILKAGHVRGCKAGVGCERREAHELEV